MEDDSKQKNSQETSFEIPEAWADFCKEELETISTTHKRNLQDFLDLKDLIKKSPYFKIQNPVKGECDKIKSNHLNELNGQVDQFERYKSEYESLQAEETKLHDEIQKNKNKPNDFDELDERLKKAKTAYKTEKTALNIAKEVYESRFGMKIEVESNEKSADTFTAIVHFNPENENQPIKLKIDRVQNKIIDFDASSVLSKDEEERLKNQFWKSENNTALVCILRNKIL